MAAVKKRQSMTSSTAAAAGSTSAVPRSTSQPGNRDEDSSPTAVCVAAVWWWYHQEKLGGGVVFHFISFVLSDFQLSNFTFLLQHDVFFTQIIFKGIVHPKLKTHVYLRSSSSFLIVLEMSVFSPI